MPSVQAVDFFVLDESVFAECGRFNSSLFEPTPMQLQLSSLLLAWFVVYTVAQTDAEWKEYKNKHKKDYLSVKDEDKRKAVWEKNYKKIKEHNDKFNKGLATAEVVLNHLSDKTDEEYKAMLGKKPRNKTQSTSQDRQVITTTTRLTTTTRTTTRSPTTTKITTATTKPAVLPQSVDYRNSTCTAPIKDQGQCGACWAFSATYETEFFNCKKKGALTVLSEQNLVDCDTTNDGCIGGWYDYAWQYTIDAKGQCSASSYPYTNTVGTCQRSSCSGAGTLTRFAFIPNNATTIMQVLASIGPVSASIDASSSSFAFYSSGVFGDPACTTNTNHAVNIMGYGTTASGIPYWIIRNSWSTDWGMNGYGFVRRGMNMCGIEGEVALPVA